MRHQLVDTAHGVAVRNEASQPVIVADRNALLQGISIVARVALLPRFLVELLLQLDVVLHLPRRLDLPPCLPLMLRLPGLLRHQATDRR